MKNPTRQTRRNGSAVATTHQSQNREITLSLSPALCEVIERCPVPGVATLPEICELLLFERFNDLPESMLVSAGARKLLAIENAAIELIGGIGESRRGASPAASPPTPILAPPAESLFGAIDDLSRSIRDLNAVMDLGERYLDDHDENRVSEEDAGDMASSFRSLKWHARGKVEFDLGALRKAWAALEASVPQCLETKAGSQGGAQ